MRRDKYLAPRGAKTDDGAKPTSALNSKMRLKEAFIL